MADYYITYLWKSSVITILFYCFYKLFLHKETYFQSIRFFLLIGIITSFILPLIVIPIYIETSAIDTSFSVKNMMVENTKINDHFIKWNQIILGIYAMFSGVFLLKFIFQLVSLYKLLRKNKGFKNGNYTLIETDKNISPFSFFNYIIYNPNQFSDNELTQILTHEKIHAYQKHSFDTIISNLLIIFQWYNPFAWLYKKEIEQNLEFIADSHTQKNTVCKKSYQKLLLKTSIPNYQMALANNFYNSLLKKRILMLHSKRSNNKSQWKFTLIIPFLLIFIFSFNTKTIAQPSKKTKTVEIESEIYAQIISKNTGKKGLDAIKKAFETKGLIIKFGNIKRNKENAITSIKIDAKTKNGKASASYASMEEDGVNPIKISFDNKNNSISIGATDNLEMNGYTVAFSDHKKIIKKKITGDKDNFVFVTNDDSDEETTKVWVDKNGDTTKIKTEKMIVNVKSDNDGEDKQTYEIIIDNDDNNEVEKEITVFKGKSADKNFVFISDKDGDSPLYIVDGEKIEKKEMESIVPDNIEKVEVLKGYEATKKYGKEAKDGVVIITTKKK